MDGPSQTTSDDETIEIVDFKSQHAAAFKQLNEAWITRFWEMEASDYKWLDHPQEQILDRGGHIFIALHGGELVGTCALIKMDEQTYELAKMAVSDEVQGRGIGLLRGQTAVEKARALGANGHWAQNGFIWAAIPNWLRRCVSTKSWAFGKLKRAFRPTNAAMSRWNYCFEFHE